MPKKFSSADDNRGAKAKAQKAAAAAQKQAKADAAAAAADEAGWKVGSNRRAAKKSAVEAEKREAKEARKEAAAAQLAAEESAFTSKAVRGSAKAASKKASKVDAKTRELAALKAAMGAKWASGMDAGIEALAGTRGAAPSAERHPERRMKAAFKAFEERELVTMKEEYPTLRRSQLKERIFAKWQKSPENPMNQDFTAFNAKPGADTPGAASDDEGETA